MTGSFRPTVECMSSVALHTLDLQINLFSHITYTLCYRHVKFTIMELIFNYDYNTRTDADILVRVYENQNEIFSEKEQCVGEVLFKNHLGINHERFTSWLPRGCSNAIVQILKKNEHLNVKVGISNEFKYNLGVLTSVSENFDGDLKIDLREQELKYVVGK